jgi:excisionase family DNA binding protein
MAIHDKAVTNRGEGLRLVLPTSLPGDQRHDARQEALEYPAENTGEGTDATPGVVRVRFDEPLLTPQQVADRLGVSERWVRDHATRRFPRIRAIKLGPLLRFRWTDVEDFLNRQLLENTSKRSRRGV